MIGRVGFAVSRAVRAIWFRPAVYVLAAVATLAVSMVLGPFVSDELARRVGAEGVDRILGILASGMLAVAVFSLTTMVAAMQAVSQAATPRVRRLLVEDRTAQNAISTFVGTFLFSLLGIVALSTGLYDLSGRFVLLIITLCLIVVVVVTLISWIQKLSHIGGVEEAVDRVEKATRRAFQAAQPRYGCRRTAAVPRGAQAVHSTRIGYVQHFDEARLGTLTESLGVAIHVVALPGSYVDPTHPLAMVEAEPDEDVQRDIRSAFVIGGGRTFDTDPRFGLLVLSEIASRALSSGVNDPGTAIDVVGTLTRILVECGKPWGEGKHEIRCPRLTLPEIDPVDIFADAFRGIARDGAGLLEVQVRLHKGLATLAAVDPQLFGKAAREMSKEALQRASLAMAHEDDIAIARAAAGRVSIEQPATAIGESPAAEA
jgi:uncharacterized membrane protein